jgi:galactitol-specific phosphotransferase system IIB component
MDLDKDGKLEEAGALIDVYLSSLFKGLKFRQKEEKYSYGINGKITKKPVVYIYYQDKDKKIPVSGIPVELSFTYGEGEMATSNLISGNLGEIIIPVVRVEPSYDRITIKIEPTFKIEDIRMPFYYLELEKRRAVSYSVSSPYLKDVVEEVLSEYNYDFVEVEDMDTEISTDYSLDVSFKVLGVRRVADYDMFKATLIFKVKIYKLPEKRLLSSFESSSFTGLGFSKSSAISKAIAKMKKNLKEILKKEIKGW